MTDNTSPQDANVPTLDFSNWDDEGGIEKLASQMKTAVEDSGMMLRT